MTLPVLIATAVGFCAVLVVVLYFHHAYASKLRRLDGRDDLSNEEIYQRFFENSGLPEDAVISAWTELAEFLELPTGKLRPADRFAHELAPPKGHEYDDPSLMVPGLLARRVQDSGESTSATHVPEIRSVSDYVVFAARLNQQLTNNDG